MHFFQIDAYNGAHELFKRHTQLQTLMDKDLLEKSKPQATDVSKKSRKTKGGKKNEKENTNPADDIDESVMPPPSAVPNADKTISHSSSVKKLTYTYRLSYSCTLKLFKVIYNKNTMKKQRKRLSDEFENDEGLENFLIEIKANDNFHLYLTNALQQQLDNILDQKQSNYDAESFDRLNLFKYLLSIWKILWQEMDNAKCLDNSCTNEKFYCAKCIQYRLVYTKCLSNIWKIFQLKFSSKLEDLFSIEVLNESEEISPTNESNRSVVAVSLLDMSRKYVERCINCERANAVNAFKLSAFLIDLMTEIASTIQLQITDFSVLFAWTQTLASQEYANDPLFGKSLLKFFIYVTWNKNSSSALMKYLCTDVVHFFKNYFFALATQSVANQVTNTQPQTQSSNETVFNFLSDKNFIQILNIIYDEQINIIQSFEWFLAFKSNFEQQHETAFYKQINCIIQSLNSLLEADLPIGPPKENLIKVLLKLFNFLISLCDHIHDRIPNESEEKLFKQIIDYSGKKMINTLQIFVDGFQNKKALDLANKSKSGLKEGAGKKKDGGGNDASASQIAKCLKILPQLGDIMEQFQQKLKTVNNNFVNKIDCIDSFKLIIPQIRQSQSSSQRSIVNTQASSTQGSQSQRTRQPKKRNNNDEEDEDNVTIDENTTSTTAHSDSDVEESEINE